MEGKNEREQNDCGFETEAKEGKREVFTPHSRRNVKKELLLWGVPILFLLVVLTGILLFSRDPDDILMSKVPEKADAVLFVDGCLAFRAVLPKEVQERIRKEVKEKSLPENLFDCRLLFFASIEEQWAGVAVQFREGQAGAIFAKLQKDCRKDSSRVKSGTVDGLPQIKEIGNDDSPDVAVTLCSRDLLLITYGKTDPAIFRSAAPNPLLKQIRFENMILSGVCNVNLPARREAKKQINMTSRRVVRALQLFFTFADSPRSAEKRAAAVFRMVPSLLNLETISASMPFSVDNPVLDFRIAFKDAPSAWEALGALNVGIGCVERWKVSEQLGRGVDQRTLFVTSRLREFAEEILKK